MVNKTVQNAILGCNLKNDRTISVRFQGKPFNITKIQVYASNSNTEEAEVEWFYEDLQDLLELIPKEDVLFIIGAKANRILPREHTGHSKYHLPKTPEKTLHLDITRWLIPKSD